MRSSITLAALATLSAASPTPNSQHHGNGHTSKLKYPGLDVLAKQAGLLYFGTAIDNVVLNNTQYVSIAHNASEFGQVTPANGQKFMYIEPQRGVFNYTMADEIVRPAIKAGQIRRCHNFVWHNQLPDWLTSRNWTKTELVSIMENHIKHEAQYFNNDGGYGGGGCYAWDVVNEAFNEDGTLRSDIWSDTIGPEYIELAFKFARKYTSPHTRLYYNDYNIETVANKSLAAAAMVKDFKKRGIPIDGVGLQAHFTVGRSPSYQQVKDAIALFNKLGVEAALTELDVRTAIPDNSTQMAQQAQIYADSVKACVDSDNCVGVTVWDFWDPVSWVPSTFPGFGDATLFDANFTRKPAYYAVSDVLRNA
jgi:endo-1,4-beta-xylanase